MDKILFDVNLLKIGPNIFSYYSVLSLSNYNEHDSKSILLYATRQWRIMAGRGLVDKMLDC